jgi:integrase
MTLNELYQKCLDDHWSEKRFVESGWKKEVERNWSRHIAKVFGDMNPVNVNATVVRVWHRGLKGTPTAANRSLEILSRVFNYGIENGTLPAGSNPCPHVKAYVEAQRTRFATEEEIGRIGAALEERKKSQPFTVAFCWTLMLTGARPRSLMRARRDELTVHGDYGVLRFAGKATHTTGEEESVVVPPQALRLLTALPHRPDGLIFGKIVYRRFWANITQTAGCSGLWLRDIRRTFATMGLSIGALDRDRMKEVLNHRSVVTTERYAKILPKAKIEAAHLTAAKMAQLGGVA